MCHGVSLCKPDWSAAHKLVLGWGMQKEGERDIYHKLSYLSKEGPNDKEAWENKTKSKSMMHRKMVVRKRSQRCIWQETQPWCHAMPRLGVVFSSSPRWWMMRHQWEPTGKAGTGIGTNVWSWLLCHKLKQDGKDWIAQFSLSLSVSLCVCVFLSWEPVWDLDL